MNKFILFTCLLFIAVCELMAQSPADSLAMPIIDSLTIVTDSLTKEVANKQDSGSILEVNIKEGPPSISKLISVSKVFWAIVFLLVP